jgi:hypothetical protein
MTEEAEKEQGEFDKFTSQALRNPRRKVYDQILGALLLKANSTGDPLKKIQTLCEACLFAKDKKNLDMALVESAYVVSSCLLKSEAIDDRKNSGAVYVAVPWPFPKTEENWKKHVQPWQTLEVHYFPFLTTYRRQHYPFIPNFDVFGGNAEREWNDKHESTTAAYKEIEVMPGWQRFYFKTEVLTVESFKALKGEFEQYYLQKLLTMQMFLAEQVNAQTYNELFRTMYGEKQKEEVDAESEDQMG